MQTGRRFDRIAMRTRAFTKPETPRRQDQAVREQSSRSASAPMAPPKRARISGASECGRGDLKANRADISPASASYTTIDSKRAPERSQLIPHQANAGYGTSRTRGNPPPKSDRYARRRGDEKKGHSRFESEGVARAAPTANAVCLDIFRSPPQTQRRSVKAAALRRIQFRQGTGRRLRACLAPQFIGNFEILRCVS